MIKKRLHPAVIILLLISLAACSSPAAATTAQTGASSSETALQSNLAVGTLKLEGTDQAVTAEQARELLPLWKAVKTLSGDDTISAEEIQALYDQIQETMSAGQIQAISQMSLTQQDLTALMADLGIERNAGAGGLTDEQRATRIAQRQSQGSGGGFAGGIPGGAMPMGGGGPPAGFTGGANAQVTPGAGQAAASQSFPTNRSTLFLDPLIKMLKERAAP
ncbi:MAG: hypothetical protein IT308_00505 [Anaerolineaceae bacterium]|nr:hypothetical protein [Anaerolineaceae bacterium]